MSASGHSNLHKLSAAGLLVSLGIIYGDIGTSPLYVMKAIMGDRVITEELVLGALSCVFWTLTIQTTFKNVIIALMADNKGEGGIFSLYALVRRRNPALIFAAIIGGASLLADSIITPPISVASAIEGLYYRYPMIQPVPIVLTIIVILFLLQRFGTNIVGRLFGPVMFVWFAMLAILGSVQLMSNPAVLRALNPIYAYNLLVEYPHGFWLLGFVFLCTTGAEALYSDMGHCGRPNIRISWIFVKIALLINYMGQGAWLLKSSGQTLNGANPFYSIMPEWFLIWGIAIAACAAIIASQALISASYTLINEAIRLNLWPKVKINYPTIQKGQLYIPSINWLLMFGCIAIVLIFQRSENMEAAYGLAISITFINSTILLSYWLYAVKRLHFSLAILIFMFFITVETAFLIANLEKFFEGGYVSLVVSGILALVMTVWYLARNIKNRLTEFAPLSDYLPLFQSLSADVSIPKYATHLVYLTSGNNTKEIETKIIYSIFKKQPKRADIYWMIHIDVVDEPHTAEYRVHKILEDDLIRIDFRLGFRVEQKINMFFRKVVQDLVVHKEVDFTSRYQSLKEHNFIGDFKFVVLEKHLSQENDLGWRDQLVMDIYFILRHFSQSEKSAFGLDTSNVTVEYVPMVIKPHEEISLTRLT